jgi:predicted secreted protein
VVQVVRHLCIKISEEERSLFSKLAEEEGITMSQALRELMAEAISRGYVSKERKERRSALQSKVSTSGGVSA